MLIRVLWYPRCSQALREYLLGKLLDLAAQDLLTIWLDQVAQGKWFYDIRHTEEEPSWNENTLFS